MITNKPKKVNPHTNPLRIGVGVKPANPISRLLTDFSLGVACAAD
ncbi:MAG: hypothetical protein UX89_C0008G0045 [Parcubacteria group bacterium GW2011_GWA2_47_16]|nr:MAG: hypothetical protein UX89_C0008G0045 [Parcubacteria group bacterium GW2011_GWA2_47_16]